MQRQYRCPRGTFAQIFIVVVFCFLQYNNCNLIVISSYKGMVQLGLMKIVYRELHIFHYVLNIINLSCRVNILVYKSTMEEVMFIVIINLDC